MRRSVIDDLLDDDILNDDLDVVYTVTYVDNLGVFDDMVSLPDYITETRETYHRYVLALDVDSGVLE